LPSLCRSYRDLIPPRMGPRRRSPMTVVCRVSYFSALLLSLAGLAQASHTPPNACHVTDSNIFLNNGTVGGTHGCTHIDKVFINFSTAGSTSNGILNFLPGDGNIEFMGVGSSASASTFATSLGIRFWTAGNGSASDWAASTSADANGLWWDSRIRYDVQIAAGDPNLIYGAYLGIANLTVTGTYTGVGITPVANGPTFLPGLTILKEICPGSLNVAFAENCSGKVTLTLSFTASSNSSSTSASFNTPQTNLFVRDRIFWHAGNSNNTRSFSLDDGNASVATSWIENRYLQVPEPSSFLLVAPAFIGLGILRRRKKPA